MDRQELLAWMNNLLQLNITKVEQCGTGYTNFSLPQDLSEKRTKELAQDERIKLMRNLEPRAALCQIYDSIFRTPLIHPMQRGHVY